MILDLLTPKQKESLKANNYKKGNIIFKEYESCNHVGFVIQGSVKIISYSSNGNEIVYGELKPGDIFGNNLLYSDQPSFRGDVIAVTDTKIILLNKEQLCSLLMSNRQFLEAYLKIESNFVKNLNLSLKLLSIPSAEERFLYYLHINKGKITFKSVTSLSEKLFLTRETTSRLISKLVLSNTIIKNKKQIIINNLNS